MDPKYTNKGLTKAVLHEVRTEKKKSELWKSSIIDDREAVTMHAISTLYGMRQR